MLLSDRDIAEEIKAGRVSIDPFDQTLIQPASLDVRLGMQFRTMDNHLQTHIDPRTPSSVLTRLIGVEEGDCFVLHPGEFILGTTLESVVLPYNIAARLEGKSTLGRLGLMVHSTAGWVDPGFCGSITLELSNVTCLPIQLWPNMRIGQLCLIRTTSPVLRPYGSPVYNSHYQFQQGPTAPRG